MCLYFTHRRTHDTRHTTYDTRHDTRHTYTHTHTHNASYQSHRTQSHPHPVALVRVQVHPCSTHTHTPRNPCMSDRAHPNGAALLLLSPLRLPVPGNLVAAGGLCRLERRLADGALESAARRRLLRLWPALGLYARAENLRQAQVYVGAKPSTHKYKERHTARQGRGGEEKW